ncbi:MAG: DJ-1/PfpI family protein [Bacteroidetes bacterium]|nr:MAG: DJ-1/PfpI family protein [Bacteroidota bacterium]
MKKTIENLILIFLLFFIINLNLYSFNTGVKKKVAILIYNGVYLLDFCGPLEIFNDTMLDDTSSAFEVYTVSPDENSIKSHTHTLIKPDYTIDNCPQPDILVIPGGNLNLTRDNPEVAKWIVEVEKKSEYVLSVCTGAFILADLGMLNGLEVTTWYGAREKLKKKVPSIKICNDKRFTDNGKIVTTAGVSAGIDGALHLVEKMFGKETALKTAKYIEYENFK